MISKSKLIKSLYETIDTVTQQRDDAECKMVSLIQEIKDLRDENSSLYEDVERLKTALSNRLDEINSTHDYVAPLARALKNKIQSFDSMLADLTQIENAYYSIGFQYPWHEKIEDDYEK